MIKALVISFSLGMFFSALGTQALTPSQTNTQQIKWLGISLIKVSTALQSQLGNLLNSGEGVMINNVQADSPAQKAGLKSYDILIKFNEHKITSIKQVYELVQQNEENKDAQLLVIRQGQKKTISAKIGTRQVNNSPYKQLPAPPLSRGFNNNFWNSPFPQPDFNSFFNQPDFSTPAFPFWPNNLPNNNVQSWSQSQSMNVTTLANGKIHAELKTKDTNGNEKNFIFEGNPESVIKDIQQQKDLPENQKQNLISALQGKPLINFNHNFFNNFPDNSFNNRFPRLAPGFPQTPFSGQWQGFQQQNRSVY